MIDSRNFGSITGGLTADPEVFGDKVLKLRLASDWAGNDRVNKENKTGYFDVTYFLDDTNGSYKFVKSQLDAGNFKKGTQLQVLYTLRQERWKTEDGNNRSQVVLVAESINYYGNKSKSDGDAQPKAAAAGASSGDGEDFDLDSF